MVRFDVPATVTVERGDQRLRCTVVGWDDHSVRCEPQRAGVEAMELLAPGAEVTVAWSTDRELLTVGGTVQGRPDDGELTIAFAGAVTAVQRRDHIRARCVFPAHVMVPDEEGVRIVEAETVDISATGIGLRANLGVEQGASVAVAVFPPDDELPLLAGRVVTLVPETGRVGIAYQSVLPGQLERVSNLVSRVLANRMAR